METTIIEEQKREELESFSASDIINFLNALDVESSKSASAEREFKISESLRTEALLLAISKYTYFDDDIQELNCLSGKKYEGSLLKSKRHGIGSLQILIKSKFEQAISEIDIFSNEGILLSLSIPNRKRDLYTYTLQPFFFIDYDDKDLAYIYKGEWKHDLKDGKGQETWPDGSYYKGSYANNTRNGYGEYTSSDGEVYIGDWKDGQKHGLGEIRWPDGSSYKGQFVNGVIEGYGEYFDRNGSKYMGEWKDGQIIFGKGRVVKCVTESNRDSLQNFNNFLCFDDNDFYDNNNSKYYISSQFVDSAQLIKKSRLNKFEIHKSKRISNIFEQQEFFEKPLSTELINLLGCKNEVDELTSCCYVRVVYLNGDRYSGLWKNGLKHGIGTYFYNNGDEYKGFWHEGIKEGFGGMKYNDGDIYIGEWKDDKKNGIGKYYWNDGSIYEGEMKNNNAEGIGVMIYTDKDTYYGEWKFGHKNGIGKYVWNDTSEYIGWYLDGEPNGIGETKYNNTDTYIGEWNRGLKDGIGKYVWASGKTFKGNWRDDSQQEFGVMLYPDGKGYKGLWNQGKPQS